MRISASWLRELTGVESGGREIAERLIAAGLEVEGVHVIGEGLVGALVVGRVQSIEELTEFKKPIRFCQVDVGEHNGSVRGIICGARNFVEGDLVAVALPGTVLPGGFQIASRETYGRLSDGMICSEREMGLGDEHDGILVLEPGSVEVGDEVRALLGIGDEILDIAVTPDRGYALSARGIAREVAIAYGVAFSDPVDQDPGLPAPSQRAKPVECVSDDLAACDLFTLSTLIGFDPSARTPQWMRNRLRDCGMRTVSLAVDVTNYVMLELGQPLHAFDVDQLQGAVRAGRPPVGALFTTLDHVERTLSADDLVILDDRGPIGLAGVMGGLDAEISNTSSNIALESAHFDENVVARTSRRHRLGSEASRRFERGVDRALAPYAAGRAMALLVELGGGDYVGMTAVEAPMERTVIEIDVDLPARVAGMPIDSDRCAALLRAVGCDVTGIDDTITHRLRVVPPTWRPDLTDPADLVEEVLRLIGYENLPSSLPVAPAGARLTPAQQMRRRVGTALANSGLVEVLTYPFVGPDELRQLRIPDSDVRRAMPTLANPLSDEQPWMRAALLFTLLPAARRNVGRGHSGVPVFEIGSVFRGTVASNAIPRMGVDQRPTDAQWQALESALPDQPIHCAAVLAGEAEISGWWGSGRPYLWSDAVELALMAAEVCGVELQVSRGSDPIFHPGRCAALSVKDSNGVDTIIGSAGELHPTVVDDYGLPVRSCAFEFDLSAVFALAPVTRPAPVFSTHPVAKEDLAVVVDSHVASAAVEQALRVGAGPLLESIRLFDVYTGPQVGEGKKSLAYALRLRADDRTLSAEETAEVRQSALEHAAKSVGAVLR